MGSGWIGSYMKKPLTDDFFFKILLISLFI